jgi:hypothetical protein
MIRCAAITYDGLPTSGGGARKLRTRGFPAGQTALRSFATAISLDTIPCNLRVEVMEGVGVPKELSTSLLSEFDTL